MEVKAEYPEIATKALKSLLPFPASFLCEAEFSAVIALQYSCLENPMDGGAWWATVHGVSKSRTWLSNFTFTFHFHALEEEMATHSSVLAWRIPGTEEPEGLPSMGLQRVGHDWHDLAAAATKMRLGSRLDIINHTSGVTVLHHSQMGQFSCRKTSLGLTLILHYGTIIYHNVIIIEIKCTINVKCYNHPQTISLPPQSMEKLSSTKLVLGAKMVGNWCVSRFPCWEVLMRLHAHTSLPHGLGINPVKPLALMMSHHYLQKIFNMCEAGSVDQNIKISKVRPQTRKQIFKGVSEELVIQWFLEPFNHFRNIKDTGEGRWQVARISGLIKEITFLRWQQNIFIWMSPWQVAFWEVPQHRQFRGHSCPLELSDPEIPAHLDTQLLPPWIPLLFILSVWWREEGEEK